MFIYKRIHDFECTFLLGQVGKKFAGIYSDQSNEDHALNKHKLISSYKNYFDAKLKPILNEKL